MKKKKKLKIKVRIDKAVTRFFFRVINEQAGRIAALERKVSAMDSAWEKIEGAKNGFN